MQGTNVAIGSIFVFVTPPAGAAEPPPTPDIRIPDEFRSLCGQLDPQAVLRGLIADVLEEEANHGQDARVSARRWLFEAYDIDPSGIMLHRSATREARAAAIEKRKKNARRDGSAPPYSGCPWCGY